MDAVDVMVCAEFSDVGHLIEGHHGVPRQGHLRARCVPAAGHDAPQPLQLQPELLGRGTIQRDHPACIRGHCPLTGLHHQVGQSHFHRGFERLCQVHGADELTTQHLGQCGRTHGLRGFALFVVAVIAHMVHLVQPLQHHAIFQVYPGRILYRDARIGEACDHHFPRWADSQTRATPLLFFAGE